ncbi:MAG: hypothetical protein FWH04_09420 [Oscillospiraceae bacterium]|nr:hypothetical protein [Oscillospiraceae bacterium]
MNKKELLKKLNKEKAPEWMYFLEADEVDEYMDNFVLHKKNNLWDVYFGERGEKIKLKTFDNEEEACEYLYVIIKDDMKYS